LLKVFTAIQDDEELNTDESQKIKEAVSIVYSNLSGRDRTQYKFGENTYGKGRLVLAVVKKYVEDHPGITLDKLIAEFPDKIQLKGYGVVRLYKNNSKDMKQDKNILSRNYYLEENEIINLSNESEIVVCRQWGSDNYNPELGNFFWFLKKAKELYPGIREII
jgi:hypothetical protein